MYLPRFYVSEPGITSPKIDPGPSWHPRAFLTPPPTRHYIDRLADAEIAYESWQIQKGKEISQRGFGPQDASELQNLMAFQENKGITGPSDDYIPGSFGRRDDFHPNPSMGDMEKGSIHVDDGSELGFTDSPDGDDHAAHGSGDMEAILQEEGQEPMPDPMEEAIQDPYDPMDPMEMDPMDPMDMGGPLEL